MKKISVIGFGKIGQAVVANILKYDIEVRAVDINPALAAEFEKGTFSTNEPGLRKTLVDGFETGLLKIGNDFSVIAGCDALIVCIPLLVGKQKQILDEPFLNCFRNIAPYLSNKQLVVIETSIPVGYGRNTVTKAVEACGKKHGEDFLLVHSPERIKSGTMLEQLLVTPKVIGGVSQEATDRAIEVYEWFFDKKLLHPVKSIEEAEMVKLAGMAYRDVNIALSNQLARFANSIGIDFFNLIPLINTDGEAHVLFPGIGVGGHCTPVYPYFLINNFRQNGLEFTLASQSRDINDDMAGYAVSLVRGVVKNKKALILGLSFRPNIKEDTFSTAYLLKEALHMAGFDILLHDAEFSPEEIRAKGFEPCTDIYTSQAEAVFLVTAHKQYKNIEWSLMAQNGCRFFVDGRNAYEPESFKTAGIQYFGIGKNGL